MTASLRPSDETLRPGPFNAARSARGVGDHRFRAILADVEAWRSLPRDRLDGGWRERSCVWRTSPRCDAVAKTDHSGLADVRDPVA